MKQGYVPMDEPNLNSEFPLFQLLEVVEKRLDGIAAALSHSGVLHDEIDKYASDLARILSKARRLKNTFLPINRLPPEVLGLIPTFFQEDPDLINATAVCSHWRMTFLSTPRLWCDINACSMPMVTAYLERSRDVPVHVRRLASPKVASLLYPHMDRIVSLAIKHDDKSWIPRAAQNLCEPAPMLSTLTFYSHPGDFCAVEIPPHFLGGSFPSLRTLVLTEVSSLARRYTFKNVTTLIWTTTSDLVGQLSRTLDSLPSLEMAIIRFHPLYRSNFGSADRIITLQHLRTLDLTVNNDPKRGLCGFMLPILPFINLPNLKKLSLQAGSGFNSRVFPSSVLFAERLPEFSELSEVAISLLEEDSAKIRLSDSRQSELIISVRNILDVDVTHDFFGGIPYPSVRKLTVRLGTGGYGQASRWVLGVQRLLIGVEVLEVIGDCAGFLWVWHEEAEYHRICPSLRELAVCGGERYQSQLSALAAVRSSVGLPLIITHEIT